MMQRKKFFLEVKARDLSGRIVRMYQYLSEQRHEKIMSKQIYRSGTSIGANIAESRFAQSTPDYISKLSIALKEANETDYWIENLYKGQYINEKEYESIHHDVDEIIKLLVSSIKTCKKKYGLLTP
jgi:four helix bundle protein